MLTGASHETTLELGSAPVAETEVGAPGSPRGTTAVEGRVANDEPATFDAVTVNE